MDLKAELLQAKLQIKKLTSAMTLMIDMLARNDTESLKHLKTLWEGPIMDDAALKELSEEHPEEPNLMQRKIGAKSG